jgi:YidC/Oxa1 family membrane protein insertase
MGELFTTVVVRPFYNILIFLVDFITSDLGIAVIILTVAFRFLIFPLSKSQIKTQLKMKYIQKPLEELKKKYKNQPEIMGREMMKLYKDNEIKPFAGLLMLLIQLPFLFGLYYVFLNSGLPEINSTLLYSFMPRPEFVDTNFLGLVDLTSKSAVLAVLVGITQYIQAKLLIPKSEPNPEKRNSLAEDMVKSMQLQMIYVMPIVLMFIAYYFGSIVALYILVGNLFSISQEHYIRHKIRKPEEARIKERSEAALTN